MDRAQDVGNSCELIDVYHDLAQIDRLPAHRALPSSQLKCEVILDPLHDEFEVEPTNDQQQPSL